MKKTLVITGISVLIVTLTALGVFVFSPKTVDFRGEVSHIKQVDEYTVYTVNGIDTTVYTVLADNKTYVKYCCDDDPDIYLKNIEVGNTIEGLYKKWFSKDNYAKTIVVQYNEQLLHNPDF